jgi:hypothetical protein
VLYFVEIVGDEVDLSVLANLADGIAVVLALGGIEETAGGVAVEEVRP